MHKLDQILQGLRKGNNRYLAKAITMVENWEPRAEELLASLDLDVVNKAVLLGITGNPGAGKSSLTDKLIRYCRDLGKRVGVIAVDPSSPLSGGAIHGDRVRMMQHALDKDVMVRSMATRGRLGGLCASAGAAARLMAASGCDPIIIETVGVGQSEIDIIRIADVTALVSAPGLGDDIQTLKAGLLEVADLMIVNKADRPGADMLALELQEVAREKAREVLMTSAAENTGIKQLYEAMLKLFEEQKSSGERELRKERARKMETVDWCVEMLRPYLQDRVNNLVPNNEQDPRILAEQIVASLKVSF